MHAVVVRVTVEDFDTARTALENEVIPRVSQSPGFVAGYWTRSATGTDGLSMAIFESEEAARTVADMIPSAPRPEGVTIDDVEVREVIADA